MPIKIQDDLPARKVLEAEHIFCDDRASRTVPGYSTASDSDIEFNAYQN